MSHLPRWREAWEQPPGFTAQRARPELGSPAAFQSRATRKRMGVGGSFRTVVLEDLSGLNLRNKQSGPLGLGWVDSWLYCERLWASVFS